MPDAVVPLNAVYRVAAVLDSERVEYAFIGGVALNTWGLPRTTYDLDLALSISEDRFSKLLAGLEEKGFVIDPVFRDGFRDRLGGMEMIHVQLPAGASLITIDLFLAETPFLRSVVSRRVAIDLGHGTVPVCTAADLLLFKLLAGRRKDDLDAENLITVQGVPEKPYLEKWAGALGVRARLDRLLERGGGQES